MKVPIKSITPIGKEAAEEIAESIEAVAEGMRQVNNTRLRRHTLIVLLKDKTKLGATCIAKILNSLDTIEDDYLKPKPQSKKP